MKNCKKRYADGGVVAKETPEQLLARISGKYGVGTGSPQEPAAPVQQPARTAPAQEPAAPVGNVLNAVARRNEELRKAANYANGGVVQFRGKGGPKDDKIPVKVAGNEINVSNGEKAVILPAATAQNPLAIAQIENLIQATNGAPPNPALKDGGKYWRGLLEPAPANGFDPQTHRGVQPLMPGHVPGSEKPLGGENPLRAIASVLPEDAPLRKMAERQTASPAGKSTNGASAIPSSPSDPLASVSPGEGLTTPGSPVAASYSTVPATPAAPEFTVANTGQEGVSKVTGAGIKSPLYTNVSDPAAAVDGLKAAEANTVNMKAGNEALARENALRQEIIDKQQPGATIAIADQGRAETQALMDKWGREQATQALSRMNPRDSGAPAHLMAADRHAETAANGQALAANTAMRGQDITANTAMADQQNRMKMERERVAGNPLDQETKRLGNELQQRIAKLQQAIIDPSTDDATRAIASRNLLALNGKTDPAPYRAFQVGGGTNAMGEKEAADVVVVNERTGEVMRSGKGQQPQAIPAANEREVGKVYDTPKGKMIWRGNGWEMVK